MLRLNAFIFLLFPAILLRGRRWRLRGFWHRRNYFWFFQNKKPKFIFNVLDASSSLIAVCWLSPSPSFVYRAFFPLFMLPPASQIASRLTHRLNIRKLPGGFFSFLLLFFNPWRQFLLFYALVVFFCLFVGNNIICSGIFLTIGYVPKKKFPERN